MADLAKTYVRDLSVSVLYDSRQRVSFCWKFFGNLVLTKATKKKIVNPNHLYCSVCLDAVKTQSEDVTFGSVKIKSYNKTVSTGNLTRHLRNDHKIQAEHDAIEKVIIKEEVIHYDAAKPAKSTQNSKSKTKTKTVHDKMTLARDLALWFCKSLTPFDYMSDVGMVDFFKKYNIILNEDKLPSRYDVSRIALDGIYDCMLNKLYYNISQDAAQHLAITFDLWTDQYRRTNYITCTLHYLTSDFIYKFVTLNTQIVEENITEDKIEAMIKNLRHTFGLDNKKIYAVTDACASVVQAVSLANMEQHLCLGHGFHNLVTLDGIKGVPEIEMLVSKCKKIIKAISNCFPDLESDLAKKLLKEFLDSLDSVIEILDCDENNPIPESFLTGIKIKEERDKEMEEGSSFLFENINIMPLIDTAIPTRWHSILKMLECVIQIGNCDAINKMLDIINRIDLKITQMEWNLLEELVNFLEHFREAVDVMSSASQNTCTINLALLFRSEIIDVLNSVSEDESLLMLRLKGKMCENIDKRFPVTKAVVAAAILDTRFMNLKAVDTYMAANNTTKTSFLASYIQEVVVPDTTALECGDPLAYPSTSTNDTSLIDKLCMKHRINACSEELIEQECWRYIASAEPAASKDGDILTYWNKNKNVFPWLAALARAVLCVPATSVPTERVFSVAGLEISTKKSRLSPIQINKMIFVHDNYKELNTTE